MHSEFHCGAAEHFSRRSVLKLMGLSGLAWLTPLSERMAWAAEHTARAKSLILLWLDGGPSQLETFDPHAGRAIAAGTTAIDTNVKGVQFASGLPQLATHMDSMAIVRNVISREGDHERANYNVKTGYRPDPTLAHPSLGAVLTHQLEQGVTEIPRHISILPSAWPGRGGYLGDQFDAFKTGDPNQPVPDVARQVSSERFSRRVDAVEFLDQQFAAGRLKNLEADKTLHLSTIRRSVQMMSSEQLKAFDVSEMPRATHASFGDTAFGRGCMAAARLVEVGVRCVEITLSGWDSHVSNHSFHERLNKTLDPAMAGLLSYLKERDQLKDTLVMCCGEFGRTPVSGTTPGLNPAAGRDHWPHGFSVALAGGGIQGGRIIGETDPEGGKVMGEKGTPIADVHATVMHCMGIDFAHELDTPVNRPMKLSEGSVIEKLIS